MMYGLNLKYEYTSKNYLRYYIKKSEIDKNFACVVNMGKFESSNLDFKFHCVAAAHRICDLYPNPVLAFSGGVDSQAMLQSFMETSRAFRVLIFRFVSGVDHQPFNREDFSGAMKIVTELGLKDRTQVLDIDLDDFYTSGKHHDYAHKYLCSSPQLTVHMHALSQITDPVVMSWNIPNIYKVGNIKTILVPNFKYFSFHRFLADQNKPGVSYFFAFSPEQFYSSLLLSPIRNLLNDPMPDNYMMDYESKIKSYHEAGFPVARQSKKLTGFEEYKDHYRQLVGSDNADQFELNLRRPYEEIFLDYAHPLLELDLDFFIKYVFGKSANSLRD